MLRGTENTIERTDDEASREQILPIIEESLVQIVTDAADDAIRILRQ
jgi:hypothetical protein